MIWPRTLLFTVLVPGTVAGLVPLWIARASGASPAWTGLRALGLLPLGAGLAVYGWCARDFARARGTPAPIDPPRELVVRGLYRWTRNPMYEGVLGILIGEALLFASWRIAVYAAGLLAVFHLFVRVYEEPTLRRSFGAAYERYQARVPRWLPRPPRTRAVRGGEAPPP